MKVVSCRVWMLLIVIIFMLVAFDESFARRTKRHKRRDVSKHRPTKLEEASSTVKHGTSGTAKLADNDQRKREATSGTQKPISKKSNPQKHKGRKPKKKDHSKKHLKSKFRNLADEPLELSTTPAPRLNQDLKSEKKSTQNDAVFVSENSVLPGWIPHVAKQKCGTCLWQECPTIDIMKRHCPSGIVRDQCNCCAQCASGVGMPCYMTSFAPIWLPPCGDDLECIPAYDEAELDTKHDSTKWGSNRNSEGICSCTDRTSVCGSNNATYENICEFRESSARLRLQKTPVSILHQGPCNTVPKIDSEPTNVASVVGDVVSFRCETSGFPLPRIQWFKINKEKRANEEIELPGYLNHAVTQMRGGPGKYQLTTWLTLDKVKETDAGEYVCRSTNEFGTSDSSASLKIKRL